MATVDGKYPNAKESPNKVRQHNMAEGNNDKIKNRLAKPAANASKPKKYPKTGNGKGLNWKKPNGGK